MTHAFSFPPAKRVSLSGTGALAALLLATLCLPTHAAHANAAEDGTPGSAPVERGQYLTRASDCEVCHTAPGGMPYAGGRAFKLPGMGVVYSTNITADKQHGVGTWSDEEFVAAVKQGVSPGGKHLYPAMPYPAYSRLSDQDVRDIRAYLATLPTSASAAPENKLRFPFSIRSLMIFWNIVNGPASAYPDDTTKSDQWNRGRWLVEGAGHCADCHSPRTLTFGLSTSKAFGGNMLNGWRIYNISSDRKTGIGGWTDAELAQYLSTGHADGHGTASGDMADVIGHSLRYLTPADIQAMVTYLRSTKPVSTPQDAVTFRNVASGDASLPQNSRGARLYASACAGCHLPDGTGRQSSFASIAGGRSLGADNGRNLIQVLVNGSGLQTATGVQIMPHFTGGGLSNRDLADIAAFVMTHFTTAQPHDLEKQVEQIKKDQD